MAKITAEQLEIADGWRQFAERLGWKLLECDVGLAKFERRDVTRGEFKIWRDERNDIERTWREAEQASVTQIKAAG